MKRIISLSLLLILLAAYPAAALQKVKAETVINLAKTQLEKTLSFSDREIRVKSRFADRNLPDGQIELRAGEVKLKKIGGNVVVPVIAYLNAKKYLTFSVVFDVRVYDLALVTVRAIKQGEIITAGDLVIKRSDISDLVSLPYQDLSELVGLRTSRYLQSGTILTAELLEELPLIMKNKTVTVRMTDGVILVETRGKALQDGYLQEMVLVKLLESNKVLSGRVVADGIVEVWE